MPAAPSPCYCASGTRRSTTRRSQLCSKRPDESHASAKWRSTRSVCGSRVPRRCVGRPPGRRRYVVSTGDKDLEQVVSARMLRHAGSTRWRCGRVALSWIVGQLKTSGRATRQDLKQDAFRQDGEVEGAPGHATTPEVLGQSDWGFSASAFPGSSLIRMFRNLRVWGWPCSCRPMYPAAGRSRRSVSSSCRLMIDSPLSSTCR